MFELEVLKGNVKGVFSRLFHCYGNLLCYDDHHLLTLGICDTIIEALIDQVW